MPGAARGRRFRDFHIRRGGRPGTAGHQVTPEERELSAIAPSSRLQLQSFSSNITTPMSSLTYEYNFLPNDDQLPLSDTAISPQTSEESAVTAPPQVGSASPSRKRPASPFSDSEHVSKRHKEHEAHPACDEPSSSPTMATSDPNPGCHLDDKDERARQAEKALQLVADVEDELRWAVHVSLQLMACLIGRFTQVRVLHRARVQCGCHLPSLPLLIDYR